MKERKRKEKEDAKRLEMLKPKTSKIQLISHEVLSKASNDTLSNKDQQTVGRKEGGRANRIKFRDEEYPDLLASNEGKFYCY